MRSFLIFFSGFLLGLLLIFVPDVFSFSRSDLTSDRYEIIQLTLVTSAQKSVELEVALADTHDERVRGLQGLHGLKSNQGMWFIFQGDSLRTFWMKDTFIPLDLLFFDDEGRLVHFVQRVPPCIDVDPTQSNCPHYESEQPSRYALEVKAGFIETHEIQLGDKMLFSTL